MAVDLLNKVPKFCFCFSLLSSSFLPNLLFLLVRLPYVPQCHSLQLDLHFTSHRFFFSLQLWDYIASLQLPQNNVLGLCEIH